MASASATRSTASSADIVNVTAAIASFTVCSMGMMVFNKLAIQAVPQPCTLVALQMAFTVLVMVTCCYRSLHIGSYMDALKWCRVVPFFVGMLLTSMLALKDAPMSLVITFRALSPIFTLLVEYAMPKPTRIGFASFCSILLMCAGASLSAWDLGNPRDNQSSWRAIGWIALNTMLACTERLLQRMMLSKDQMPVDVSKTAASLLNNLFGMFPLMIVAFLLGETSQIGETFGKLSASEWLWVGSSCLVGVGISFTAIWTQSVISATSMLILTNANKFVVMLLEIWVMPELHRVTPRQSVGAAIAIIATLLYAHFREKESSMEAQKTKAATEQTALIAQKA
eukprot:TRINITY_DN1443_c0_g1_i10.p1 TRINITY_DN1443_c0_g1~~TRINITY_DN1443_c0_g1_i10.p1  ORF type:complete len:340 (-),score=58.68 TRINITY_DN1443_c0_g1_i10:35-1054(-)